MSRNAFAVPANLYDGDLPPGYECTMYVGRMVGQLGTLDSNKNFTVFSFEIHDVDDPTEMVLKYGTYEAPAQELARWENVGDTVGIVVESKDKNIDMVLAYNFTRRKWFGTGYYPHRSDENPANMMTLEGTHKMAMILAACAVPLICFFGIGFLVIPVAIYFNWYKTSQYKKINPTDYRGATAKKIADWITANADTFASSGNPSLDPSL